ncbi:sulfotransferase domain-containing protein [Candidatus Pelagibacter bacterium]|jgi:hypothetical protein|nr:sulfotransferase domain-containing protein [Candidatus Pelagibacter bacterium]MDA8837589.1 sulfotransferase domain-containing protein [Candidatus Pelagibacter bacterium]
MIIWIASYPKSGNTWLRSIISALVYSKDGIFTFDKLSKIDQFPEKKFFKDLVKNFRDFDEIKKNWIAAQDKINLDEKIKFFKTHQGNFKIGNDHFTNNQNTQAVIYIVRDPRNLVTSISNHYSLSLNEACKFLTSPELMGNGKSWEEKKDGIFNFLGKWNEHYKSWTNNTKNLLLLRYEDLINEPKKELEKIIFFLNKYINFDTNDIKIDNILESTNFKNLKKMEQEGSFTENVIKKETGSNVNFFNLGPKNIWQNSLDKKIIKKIEDDFKDEMKEIGYL